MVSRIQHDDGTTGTRPMRVEDCPRPDSAPFRPDAERQNRRGFACFGPPNEPGSQYLAAFYIRSWFGIMRRKSNNQISRNILVQKMDTVLVIGATGNIGVAAVLGALRSKRNVLAIVRNQASANKLFQHVGTKEGITTVEADIMSDQGVQTVVDQVRAGKLPHFQHVYSAGKSLTFLIRTRLTVSTSWWSIRCDSIARYQH